MLTCGAFWAVTWLPDDSLRVPEIRTQSQPGNEVVPEAAQVGRWSSARTPWCSSEKVTLGQMMMPDASEKTFQAHLPDIQVPMHEMLEKREVPKLAGSHEHVMERGHEPEVADNGRPSVCIPGLHDATSDDRQRDIRRFIEAFPRTVAATRSSFVSDQLPASVSEHPTSSALTLLHPTPELFALAPGPRPCSPVTSTSLKRDTTLAMPSPGNIGPVFMACRGHTFWNSRA